MNKKSRSYSLDIIRVIAVLMITLNHAVNRGFQNYEGQREEFLSSSLISSVIKAAATVASHYGVPLFLMVTGALLLKRFHSQEDITPFYKKNLKSLFITTEIWYFIMFWCLLAFDEKFVYLRSAGLLTIAKELVKTLCLVGDVAYSSMWYMPMILCVYTLLPFIGILVNQVELKKFRLPCLILYLFAMVLPALTALMNAVGFEIERVYPTMIQTRLFSYYVLYILAGYYLVTKKEKHLSNQAVYGGTVFWFVLMVVIQFLVYARPLDYLLDYEFPLFIFGAGFLFESVQRLSEGKRRKHPVFLIFQKYPLRSISSISLSWMRYTSISIYHLPEHS